jgi:prepilin-type N-terminal cleavage/methylation domain-containing protein
MSLIGSSRGVTLVELLLVIALVASSVVIISLTFPKAAATITQNRRRALAVSFASAKLQELKETAYPYLDPTPATSTYFSDLDAFPASGCDCSQENMSKPAFLQATYIEAGTTYSCYVCINLIDRQGAGWTSYCADDSVGPAGADKGLKNIRVRVEWKVGNNSHQVDMESLVTR